MLSFFGVGLVSIGLIGGRILIENLVRAFPFGQVASAKLVLTDKLINATAPLSTEGADTIKTEG